MTEVVVADDSALLREGLVGLLERQGFTVTGTAQRADDLRARVEQLAAAGQLPDLVITDVRMPPTMTNDGLQAAIDLKTAHPRLAIIVLSQYVAAVYAQQLFALPAGAGAGGAGYLLKDRVAEVADFIASVRVVLTGGVVIDPEVARAMMQSSRSGLGELTPRELEVLELMAQGLSNAQIAERLFLSGAAVAKHISAIFLKLGLEPGEENRRVRAILAFLAAGM
ncbi:response regulator transcription factor [Buchananella hordeovulneris]|uniref:response regulator transcription factor n=1 Tax=Buchananella hordeovulneris TaxID=52770 RepID=UPI000F5DC9FB|nr:response regulator transcription factor [Buchananella hordeovulneris]MDO5080461.1 response regulator transcription factor [Buchananella hordeovulneris]RRD44312.1 DNA-binding response regulator [Buchananella hordeovulneris]RRD51779.1 DNA-binding response regulator [Buchananella hordeovulneris]